MPNDFFTASSVPGTSAALSSATMRAEFDAIEAGFDKMPTLTGNGNKAVVVNAAGTALSVTAAALALAVALTTAGSGGITLRSTAATDVTLPTTGTLATLAGAETLTNKTLTAPVINTSLTAGFLTNGRVPYYSTTLIDSANLTFNGTTLTAHTLTVSTGALTATGGVISLTKSQNSDTYTEITNANTGTSAAALYKLTVNGTNTSAYIRATGSGWSGLTLFTLPLGLQLYTDTGMTGGISIAAREANSDVRIFAGGIANADLVATFADDLSTTLAGTLTVSGATITTGSTTALSLATSGGTQAKIANATGTAVNYVSISGAATGSGVRIIGRGTDTDVALLLSSQAAGAVRIFTGATSDIAVGVEQLRITHTASADRYLTVTGGVSGSGTNATIDVSGGAIQLSAGTNDIQWGKALVALGGGAAATLGTIGGSGPATAGQNTWMRVLDSTGAAFWVPAWK